MNTRIFVWTVCIAGTVACANTPMTSGTAGADTDSGTADSEAEEASCGPEAEFGVEVGMCAPEFSLPDRNDIAFSLHSQRGKVALVDISAIW